MDQGDTYAGMVGRRLRQVREQQRLTLRAVEVLSHGRFNTVTLGAYERGERAVTVERAAELAWLYGVALAELLDDHVLKDGGDLDRQ